MEELFIKIFNMSMTAGWISIAVILVRLLVKRVSKRMSCALWALVGLRLVLPFSFKSPVSMVPSTQTLPEDILVSSAPRIDSGVAVLDSGLNPVISTALPAAAQGDGVSPAQVFFFVISIIWLVGMSSMFLYAAVSYIRLRILVRESVHKDGVWICDRVDAPFILGLFRPRIYMPSRADGAEAELMLEHERIHIRRFDHLWKPLGFILLGIFWFNPLLWISYTLFCRDIELACDEKVLLELGDGAKKPYSEALINCGAERRTVNACPLAFGETGIKERVKNVLDFKKKTLWVIIAAALLCVAVAGCALSDPVKETGEKSGGETEQDAAVAAADISVFSENKDVSITVKNFDYETGKINVEWHNDSDIDMAMNFYCGVYEYSDGLLVRRPENDELAFIEIALELPAHGGSGETYYDISSFTFKPGTQVRIYLNSFSESDYYIEFTAVGKDYANSLKYGSEGPDTSVDNGGTAILIDNEMAKFYYVFENTERTADLPDGFEGFIYDIENGYFLYKREN